MQEFLIYNLKVAVCLAAFYLFYKLLLSRETFHRLNRAVLVGVMVLSFLLPVCRVTVYRYVQVSEVVEWPEAAFGVPAETAACFDWTLAAAVVFAAGVAAMLLRMAVSVGAVVRIIREGRHERLDSQAILVRLSRRVAPFSWIRWIVVSERDLAENGDVIIAHERAHIRLRHSYDLLATDLLATLQWFNPAMWLLRAELRAVHEYEADAAVLAGGADAREYQMLLIEKAVGGRWCSVANSLNHSKLKNRITMMLRKKSSRWATARVLFVLPLVCAAAAAFARTEIVPVTLASEDKVTENYSIGEIAPDNPQAKAAKTPESDVTVVGYVAPKVKTGDVVVCTGNLVYTNAKAALWIVDGREVTEDEAKALDADNIRDLTVYKDGAAVERYGDKGRDGVIEIRTKKFQQDIDSRMEELNKNLSSVDGEEWERRVKELNENLSSIDSDELFRRAEELNEKLSSIDSDELCRRAEELNEKLSSACLSQTTEVEYYVDGKKVSREELEAVKSGIIANMNIDKFDDHTRIDITTNKN